MSSTRLKGLDGLRALSALSVMAFHYSPSFKDYVPGWFDRAAQRGMFGVDMFFVISGFLITGLLLADERRSRAISLKAFYGKRALRILPPALAYLFAVLLMRQWFGTPVSDRDFISSLFFFRNWVSGGRIVDHYWTLSLEEQFYIVWPLLLCIVSGRTTRLVMTLGLLAVGSIHDAGAAVALQWPTRLRYDGLLTGCLLAQALQYRRAAMMTESWFVRSDAVFWSLAALFGLCTTGLAQPIGPHLQPLLLALIVVYVIGAQRGLVSACLNAKAVVWIGLISYSLYIWQQPFAGVPGIPGWMALFPVNVIAAFVLATLSHYAIERPCASWRRRLFEASPRPMIRVEPVASGGAA